VALVTWAASIQGRLDRRGRACRQPPLALIS